VTQEYVPLSSAAATAYLTLADRACGGVTDGLRDVAAIALATCIPIYGAGDAYVCAAKCSKERLMRELSQSPA
jgi:2-methylisocitrate lyase-like PEP mutase family enzyme